MSIKTISSSEYDIIANFILFILMENKAGRVTLDQLLEKANMKLIDPCPRNTYLLLLRVKEDMAVRGQIRIHIDKEKVQHIWLSDRTKRMLAVLGSGTLAG
ncbi:MAG: hypothetical protein QM762_13325 [Chryseolinea sp.]